MLNSIENQLYKSILNIEKMIRQDVIYKYTKGYEENMNGSKRKYSKNDEGISGL